MIGDAQFIKADGYRMLGKLLHGELAIGGAGGMYMIICKIHLSVS